MVGDMTYRRRYRISLITFWVTVLYMFSVEGRMMALAMAEKIGAWNIFELCMSFALVVAASVWLIIARSQKKLKDADRDWLLIESQYGKDDDTRK